MEGGDCGGQASHVGTRGTTLLFVAKPANHTWAQKASKDLWQQGNQCFPVLGVSLIHRGGLGPRSANIWRAWSMGEDAPLMSGIKDRHCAMDDAIY